MPDSVTSSNFTMWDLFFTQKRKRLITSILLAAFCAVWVYPLIWMVSGSFKPNSELFQGTGLIPDSPTFSTMDEHGLKQICSGILSILCSLLSDQ